MHYWVWAVGALLLAAPFLLLGIGYDALPTAVPLLRGWDGEARVTASKSLVTIFRVPVIGMLTAMAAALMARHGSNCVPVYRFWLTLFLTACLKSLCEGIEFAAGIVSEEMRGWARRGAITAVIVGLAVAASQLPMVWPDLRKRANWRLHFAEKACFAMLATGYLLVAILPILFTW